MSELSMDLRFIMSIRHGGEGYRGRLFRNFMYLSWLKILSRFNRIESADVLGFRVYMPDYHSFFHMYREIFIRNAYYFEPNVEVPTILDCGGNIGLSVIYFKHLFPDSTITVFEPMPKNREYLEKNIQLNELQDVKVEPSALGKEDGQLTLYVNKADKGGGKVTSIMNIATESEEVWEETMVPVRKLSDFINQNITCIKMDVEGAEGLIIKELASSGALKKVTYVIGEYHFNEDVRENSLRDILDHLEDAGLRARVYVPDNPMPTKMIYKSGSTYHTQFYAINSNLT